MSYKVISFYLYTGIVNPPELATMLRRYCLAHELLGRVLIAAEGINGAVSGPSEQINLFKMKLQEYFPGLTFREQDTSQNAYHKLVCKVRKEMCVFGKSVDVQNSGIYLSPPQLKEWYDHQENFVIVDARNDYEYELGHFTHARKLPLCTFRQFAEVALSELQSYKNTKIILYCTGGVRCEKASAYLTEQGFTQVFQLEGGIINYAKQIGSANWEGSLFVFDDRLSSDIALPITKCTHCHTPTGQLYNCHNLACDRLFVSCPSCTRQWRKTCSKKCADAPHQRKEYSTECKAHKNLSITIGIVQQYYQKAKAALVKVEKSLATNSTVTIQGKTTRIMQTVREMRDNDGNPVTYAENQLITIAVNETVRKNDRVFVEQK